MCSTLSLEWLRPGLTLHAYGFFMAAALITTTVLGAAGLRRAGIPLRAALVLTVFAAVSVPLGARLWYAFAEGGGLSLAMARLTQTRVKGFTLAGGLFLSLGVSASLCKAMRIPFYQSADAAAPGLFVGLALMRVGCFLNGCCFGKPCSLPWAVRFPPGSPAHLYYLAGGGAPGTFELRYFTQAPFVHPTQLYEMGGALAAVALALALTAQKRPRGIPFLCSAALYTATRLVAQFFRAPVPGFSAYAPWLYPLVYGALLAAATGLLLRMKRQGWAGSPIPGRTASDSSALPAAECAARDSQ